MRRQKVNRKMGFGMTKIFECDNQEDEDLIRAFLRMIDKEDVIRDVKLIPVYPYGSQGLMPHDERCPLDTHNSGMSCVGSSGDNCCTFFLGDFDETVVKCGYTKHDN
jgi:hypothetical protein